MLRTSSGLTQDKINKLLGSVGDMALKRRARRILEEFGLKDKDEILEVGCGNGYYLSLLNRLKKSVKLTGIDNDTSALRDAKIFINDKRVKIILSSAEALPFKNNSFDKVIMSEVIEHVNNEKKTLQEIYRVLRKDGTLVLTTCNINYPFLWDPINYILQHFFGTHIKSGFWAGIWNQHQRLYTQNAIRKLVEDSGLKIEKLEPLTFWCLPFNHYIVNLIAKLFYSNKLPKSFAKGINKFQNNKQPFFVKLGFNLINKFDSLNDLFPRKSGVSIFVKAVK